MPYHKRLRRRKPVVTLAPTIYDRRALDPPVNTRIAAGLIDDPYGEQVGPTLQPALRRDGSVSQTGKGEWLSPGQPKIIVLRSIRHDPLGWMHSHARMGEAEYLAGRRWQMLHERSHLGSVQAVDTTKEPVDGGQMPDLLTDAQRSAIFELRAAEIALAQSVPGDRGRGQARVTLVRDVLGAGMFVTQAAAARGAFAERQIAALSRELVTALAVLAVEFGFAGQQEGRMRSCPDRTRPPRSHQDSCLSVE